MVIVVQFGVVRIAAKFPRLVCVCYWGFPSGVSCGVEQDCCVVKRAFGRPRAMLYRYIRG